MVQAHAGKIQKIRKSSLEYIEKCVLYQFQFNIVGCSPPENTLKYPTMRRPQTFHITLMNKPFVIFCNTAEQWNSS